jgi:hypothetical protein
MKARKLLLVVALMAVLIPWGASARADFGDIIKGAKKAMGLGGGGLSEGRIIEGLKEALQIGTGNAVETVSRIGGYLNDPRIKIPLPKWLRKVEKLLRATGFGSQLDAFESSMNTAAEKAAPEAKAIFWDAVKDMNFADAKKILNGADNEATLYFKDKTYDRLHGIFKPIVHDTMSAVGVTRQYQELTTKTQSLPFTKGADFDLDNHVTGGALDGLFLILAEEEKKIRQDPAARVTDLLKEVFGKD